MKGCLLKAKQHDMVDWRKLKKIEGHVHILPDAVHAANPEADDEWVYADLQRYREIMNAQGIERAVIMPFNDPWLMSMEFTVEAVHRHLADMKRQYPGAFYAFADVDTRNTPRESVEAIDRAIFEYGLDGVKLHPNNTGVAVDSEYNQPILAFAQEHRIPVAIHCYPNSEEDPASVERIVRTLERYPCLTAIVSHMGARQWEGLLPTRAYVDFSAVLPDYVRSCGIAKTNEILRSFGSDRLIFATDYPASRILKPEEIYNAYFEILNRMDFTQAEAQEIAYSNIERLFNAAGKG